MKIKITAAAALVLTLSLMSLAIIKKPAVYTGEWSNGRGFRLVITEQTVKLGNNKALKYKDVTKVTDGTVFYLQIFNPGKMNYFSDFIAVTLDSEDDPTEMQITQYETFKDMFDGENAQGTDTFYRDGDSDAN